MRSNPVRFIAFLISVFLIAGSDASFGQIRPATGTYRILLVGDSWAEVTFLHRSLERVFTEQGLPDIRVKGDRTAIGGSRADQWAKPDRLALVERELTENPTLDFVHVFLGGNDLNGAWNRALSQEEQQALFARIAKDLSILVERCLSVREDVQVVLCGYDYVNFEEPRWIGDVPWCATEAIWSKLGRPTPAEINQAFIDLEEHKKELAAGSKRVHHLDNFGLMQCRYGYPARGLAAQAFSPGGDENLPSPPEALNDRKDCLHLSREGYDLLAENAFLKVYSGFFQAERASTRKP
jgi:lysophospholipase L1-like esterase